MRRVRRATGVLVMLLGTGTLIGCAAEVGSTGFGAEVGAVPAGLTQGAPVERLSHMGGSEPDARVQLGYDVSPNGRYVVFASAATNLVAGDSNGATDVFFVDRKTRSLEVVSVSMGGGTANSDSYSPSVSDNGNYVAFVSLASDLVRNDTNEVADIFVRDLRSRRTTRVSVSERGEQASGASGFPDISGTGGWVTFVSSANDLVSDDTNAAEDIFLTHWQPNNISRISVGPAGAEADGPSAAPHIDHNGTVVVFSSTATNLVSDDGNNVADVFVHDRTQSMVQRVSLPADPTIPEANQASMLPELSPSGRHVVFRSYASNLVADDTNGTWDVFWVAVGTRSTERISVSSDGGEADASSVHASVDDSGRYVAFASNASNLVDSDTNGTVDVFLRDRLMGTTTRVDGGLSPNARSQCPVISGNGTSVVFRSEASNLVKDDNNGVFDLFSTGSYGSDSFGEEEAGGISLVEVLDSATAPGNSRLARCAGTVDRACFAH